MNNELNNGINSLVSTIIPLVLAGIVAFFGLTNRKLLWINDYKTATITLAVIGMALCTKGIGRVATSGQWLHPLSIVAYVFGITIIAISLLTVFEIPVPLLPNSRYALISIIVLIGLKYAVSAIHLGLTR
jgi:hypothetical protein